MNSITRNQWIAIAMLALGLIAGSTAQMTDWFGPVMAKNLASAAGFLSSFVAGIQVILGGQGQQVLDVKNMPGVEKIDVNAKANQTLAKLALDPSVDKVGIASGDKDAVIETAKGG